MTVLAADPSRGSVVKEEDVKGFPGVAFKTVRGASHVIQIDAPQVIVETALQGTELEN